ncbi:1462_t:CDS:2, partial [Racocetra persica]
MEASRESKDYTKNDSESDTNSSEDESGDIVQKEKILLEYSEQLEIYLKEFKIKDFDYSKFNDFKSVGSGATANVYSATLEASIKYIINYIANPDVNLDTEEHSECSQQITKGILIRKPIQPTDEIVFSGSTLKNSQFGNIKYEAKDFNVPDNRRQRSAMPEKEPTKINHANDDLDIKSEENSTKQIGETISDNSVEFFGHKKPEMLNKIIADVNQNSNDPILKVHLSSETKMVSDTKPQELLCMASLIANDYIPEDVKCASSHVDIVLVLDVSGSILNFIVDELPPNNRLCLITFNTSARCITPLLFVNDDNNKRNFHKSIQELVTSGGTNIGKGLELGMDILMQSKTENSIPGMILLSDGKDNFNQSYEHLYERACKANFGYGSDHDATKLYTISEKTEGLFTYIYEFEQINQCFAGCIGGLVSTLCHDVNLTLRIPKPISNVKISEVLCEYENNISDEEISAQIKIRNIYAGEKKDLLFKIKIQDNEYNTTNIDGSEENHRGLIMDKDNFEENTTNLKTKRDELTIEADINYFDVHKGLRINCSRAPATLKINYSSSQIGPSNNPANAQVVQQNYRYRATKVISEANKFAKQGDYHSAQTVIEDLVEEVESHQDESSEIYTSLVEDLKYIKPRVSNSRSYENGGEAHALSVNMVHSNQRSFNSPSCSSTSSNIYQNSSSSKFSERASSLIPQYNPSFPANGASHQPFYGPPYNPLLPANGASHQRSFYVPPYEPFPVNGASHQRSFYGPPYEPFPVNGASHQRSLYGQPYEPFPVNGASHQRSLYDQPYEPFPVNMYQTSAISEVSESASSLI